MQTSKESFHQAHKSHRDWQIDRPLIDKFNRSELKVALGLLSDEIDELNGGDHTGIFTKENFKKNPRIKSDYRQQEISDIMVFAMTSFDKLDMKIDADQIYARANAWANEHSFQIVSPEDTLLPPQALSGEADQTYELLKKKLNEQAAIISNYDGGDTTQVAQSLESILVYCTAMHSLLGVDSGKAIMEKVARNMIKYPAFMFKLPIKDMTAEELEAHYHRVRKESATEFDGKFDPELGDKPKTGTSEFYAPQEILEEENDPDQQRELGILYQALAQTRSTHYGEFIIINKN